MIFQNLRFPQNGICEEKELYFHESRDNGRYILDLDGYFNLFYIEKHIFFTDIDRLRITFKAKGFVKACLMLDRGVILEKELTDSMDSSDDPFSLVVPYGQYKKGVYWLRLIADDKVPENERCIEGCFEGELKKEAAPVNIAVAICTFKRETYVIRNIRSMLDYFEANKELAAHFHVFLVDNGKTLSGHLDFQELLIRAEKVQKEIGADEPLLRLIENANTGGTGGFTRGMIEAIREKERLSLSNLLLLDDDAVFDPELFLRLYSLIVSLKDEYRNITIGGAMWREDMPYLQHAMGEWHERFKITNPLLMLDLRKYSNCIKEEMCKADPFNRLFSGWWCCCYSMELITNKNLPMPLFIHRDDILFCRQHADYGIMFLPGIGVWHQGFELRFPGVTNYYNTRNELITAAVVDDMSVAAVARWVTKQLSGPLFSFRYAEMELAYRGMLDFLKGPKWLDNVDPEKINKEVMEYFNQRVKYRPLKEILDEENYNKFRKLMLSEDSQKKAIFDFWTKRTSQGSLKKYITLNGWLLPSYKKMGLYANSDTPWSLYRRGKVLIYEPQADRGYIEKKRPSKMVECAFMVAKVTVLLIKDYRKMERLYRQRAGV